MKLATPPQLQAAVVEGLLATVEDFFEETLDDGRGATPPLVRRSLEILREHLAHAAQMEDPPLREMKRCHQVTDIVTAVVVPLSVGCGWVIECLAACDPYDTKYTIFKNPFARVATFHVAGKVTYQMAVKRIAWLAMTPKLESLLENGSWQTDDKKTVGDLVKCTAEIADMRERLAKILIPKKELDAFGKDAYI